MERWKKVLEESPLLLAFFLAFFGGVVRGMGCWHDEFTWWGFIYRVLAAGFIGVLVGLFVTEFDFPPRTRAEIIGGSGYAAVDLLQYIPQIIKERLGKMSK